jgi:hypothetical protein
LKKEFLLVFVLAAVLLAVGVPAVSATESRNMGSSDNGLEVTPISTRTITGSGYRNGVQVRFDVKNPSKYNINVKLELDCMGACKIVHHGPLTDKEFVLDSGESKSVSMVAWSEHYWFKTEADYVLTATSGEAKGSAINTVEVDLTDEHGNPEPEEDENQNNRVQSFFKRFFKILRF